MDLLRRGRRGSASARNPDAPLDKGQQRYGMDPGGSVKDGRGREDIVTDLFCEHLRYHLVSGNLGA